MDRHHNISAHAEALRGVLVRATLANCLDIARELLILARTLELPKPATHEIEPLGMDRLEPVPREQRQRMVLPLSAAAKARLGLQDDETVAWRYHVTTEFVAKLLVDKLTTESGEAIETYLACFFEYPDYLRLTAYDVSREGEPA